ncbi:MAG: lysophospholipid acyltransferase family protein [Fibrobacteres bacterium]|jgi:lauroyl/myristoyl acyltransferase|nr:lysophospholipid acyltransferase family protein [Fibrobacterota bacterium]
MKPQSLYLRILALPLGLLLYIGGWKRRILRENVQRCGIRQPFFRLRFCTHAALDFVRLTHGRYGQTIRTRPQDAEKLKKLKSAPAVFLTAHFHHWELMGAWMTAQGIGLLSAARPMAHQYAQRLLIRMRSRLGLATVSDRIPRRALHHLEHGGCFGMLWDQRAQASSVRAAFFDQPLGVDPLPLFLLRHRSVEVWFGTLLPDGTFRLLLLAAPTASPSVSLTPARLARRYHRVLEVLIRMHPTWWYGMAHRRFLESPPLKSLAGVSRETSAGTGDGWRENSRTVSRETKISPELESRSAPP